MKIMTRTLVLQYAKLHQDARRALQVKGDARSVVAQVGFSDSHSESQMGLHPLLKALNASLCRLRGSRVDVAALYTAEGSSLGEPGAAAGAPDQDLLHQQDQHQPFQKRLSSEPPPDPIIYASTESHLSPCGSPSLNDYMCHSRDTSALHMSTAPTSQRKLFEQQEDVSEDRIGESASGFGGSCHATGASWAGSASSITSSTSSASLCTETSSELVLQRLPDSMPAGLVMVQALVSASGQGCADILLLGAGKSTAGSSSRSAGPRDGTSKSVWKTR